jgi:hypothetical protein
MGDVIHLPAPEVIVKKSGDRVEISAARKETTPFAAPPSSYGPRLAKTTKYAYYPAS